MAIYEIIEDEFDKKLKRTDEDGTVRWIPFDPANSDYQTYLESLKS
jgi:hypothetical protein